MEVTTGVIAYVIGIIGIIGWGGFIALARDVRDLKTLMNRGWQYDLNREKYFLPNTGVEEKLIEEALRRSIRHNPKVEAVKEDYKLFGWMGDERPDYENPDINEKLYEQISFGM